MLYNLEFLKYTLNRTIKCTVIPMHVIKAYSGVEV